MTSQTWPNYANYYLPTILDAAQDGPQPIPYIMLWNLQKMHGEKEKS